MIFPILILLSALVCQAQSQDDLWLTEDSDELQLRDRRHLHGNLNDIHSGEFCVNVSTYGEIEWKTIIRKKCFFELEKNCTTKVEKVCADMTEITCEIVPFTKCEMNCENKLFNRSEMVAQEFKKYHCYENYENTTHKKYLPECRNITKQNCVSKWETDENGNQVWAGDEDCEPVTWRECKLVPTDVKFRVPKVYCNNTEIHYTDVEVKLEMQALTSMECKVDYTVGCKPTTKSLCKEIQFEECNQIPKEKCMDKEIWKPVQEFKHKKKCLLAGVDSLTDFESLNPRESTPSFQDADIVQEHVTPSSPAVRPVIYDAINRADRAYKTPGQVRDGDNVETYDDSEYGKREVESKVE